MKTFKQLKSEYIKYLKSINYSEESLKSYDYCLTFYNKYLKECQVKNKDIYLLQTIINYNNYLVDYKNKGIPLKQNTIYKLLSSLKNLFKYLIENNYIFINPFIKIESIKINKTLPKNIPDETDINKIISEIDASKKTGLRDLAIIELFYSTGIRKNELETLTIYDIDLNNGFIRVTGKGNKDRIVPVGKTACKYIENYLNNTRAKLLKKNKAEQILFISNQGKKMSKSLLRITIKKYLAQTDITKNIHCHSFRHACATSMLKGNANIKHIQEMLGHERLSTTQIYTQVLPLDLIEVHKKTHPSWNLFD